MVLEHTLEVRPREGGGYCQKTWTFAHLMIDPDIVLGGPTGRIKLADESMTFWQSTCRLNLGVRLESGAIRWEGERRYLVDEQDCQYRNG